jgi:Fur family transcriptional regulator, stress-responsive regulator
VDGSDDDLAESLREQHLRATPQRLAVLQALSELPEHPDVREIAARARARLGVLSIQAVYDGLRALTAAGLLRRVELAGSPARYELHTGDLHHHVVCRICGAVRDIPADVAVAPWVDSSQLDGFVIDEAALSFWGLCPKCQTAETARH